MYPCLYPIWAGRGISSWPCGHGGRRAFVRVSWMGTYGWLGAERGDRDELECDDNNNVVNKNNSGIVGVPKREKKEDRHNQALKCLQPNRPRVGGCVYESMHTCSDSSGLP
ncbi:unnamed protein product [Ectocarpus sp. 8 AP-2014]